MRCSSLFKEPPAGLRPREPPTLPQTCFPSGRNDFARLGVLRTDRWISRHVDPPTGALGPLWRACIPQHPALFHRRGVSCIQGCRGWGFGGLFRSSSDAGSGSSHQLWRRGINKSEPRASIGPPKDSSIINVGRHKAAKEGRPQRCTAVLSILFLSCSSSRAALAVDDLHHRAIGRLDAKTPTPGGRGCQSTRSGAWVAGEERPIWQLPWASKAIGDGGAVVAHPFDVTFPIHTDRFQHVSTRFQATGIGSAAVNSFTYKDIRDKGRRSLPIKTVA